MGARITITGVGPEPTTIEIDREIIVGRSVKSDVQIDGDLVSRQHCRIWPEGGRVHFRDLQSRNGTMLNGQRTDAGVLQNGDVLMIGYGKLAFEEDELPAPPVPPEGLEVSIIDAPVAEDSAVLAEAEESMSGATMALSYADLVLANQRMATVVRVNKQLATILDRDELLREVLKTFFELYNQADRGAIVLRDATNNSFRVAATQTRDERTFTHGMSISTRLISLVRKEKKAVLSADTGTDTRFADSQSLVSSGGRSIMCAPLLRDTEFLGVIYLDTPSLRQPFTAADLNLLQGIAGPVAIAIKNAELIASIETETKMRTSLSRYLSPDVVRQIGEGALKPNLGGDQVEGTVMFSDIVGFTAMSERLQPAEIVARLNRYFTQMLEAIFGWNGTVDKFGGDAIMAVWGAPVTTPDHAMLAVSGALEMQQRLFDLVCAFREAGEIRIAMGLGLNSGKFVAGNIGGAERIEWTVIGDNVNLAQRVESKGFGGAVLVSEFTFAQLAGTGSYSFAPVKVKNKAQPVTIYSMRAVRAARGSLCSIPGTLYSSLGKFRALVVKTQPRSGGLRVTIYSSGAPQMGEHVEFLARMLECPGDIRLRGKVATQAPLIESKDAKAVDVDVESMDPELKRIFDLGGPVPAPVNLDQIERTPPKVDETDDEFAEAP